MGKNSVRLVRCAAVTALLATGCSEDVTLVEAMTGGGGTDAGGDVSADVPDGGADAAAEPPECVAGERRCASNAVQTCDKSGTWGVPLTCPVQVPTCIAGACIVSALCSDHWCWENPIPGPASISWGSGPNDVWGSTSGGLLHWDGSSWRIVRTGIAAITGTAANDIWGTSSNAGATSPAIWHWDGKDWTVAPEVHGVPSHQGGVQAMWAASPTRAWATECHGFLPPSCCLVEWDGQTWTEVKYFDGLNPGYVWGSSADDVWVAGSDSKNGVQGLLWHWDGIDWSLATPPALPGLSGLWGTSSTNLWWVGEASLANWNGASWSYYPKAPGLGSIWGASAADVWGGGYEAPLQHWDGAAWLQHEPATYAAPGWGSSANDVWATNASSAIFHWDGTRWAGGSHQGFVATETGNTWLFVGDFWAASGDDAWAVEATTDRTDQIADAGSILHWDGVRWTIAKEGVGADAIWGGSATDIWAVGPLGKAWHWDGATWSMIPTGTTLQLRGVWGTGPNDVWATTLNDYDPNATDVILHWDGVAWSAKPCPPGKWTGIWGSSANDVWAVGDQIMHWDGMVWNLEASLPAAGDNLNRVWGASSGDVWAVGLTDSAPLAMHWDGTTWSSMVPLGESGPRGLTGVWGSGNSDVWATGGVTDGNSNNYHGYLLHWDGQTWSRADELWTMPLTAVFGTAKDDFWIAAEDGTILRHRP
jgi:hypothetical protein